MSAALLQFNFDFVEANFAPLNLILVGNRVACVKLECSLLKLKVVGDPFINNASGVQDLLILLSLDVVFIVEEVPSLHLSHSLPRLVESFNCGLRETCLPPLRVGSRQLFVLTE